MAENSIFLTTKNKIDKIVSFLTNNSSVLNGNNDCCKDMISSLSFFLCQIPQNNYYTETYLPDQYQNFENFMKLSDDSTPQNRTLIEEAIDFIVNYRHKIK